MSFTDLIDFDFISVVKFSITIDISEQYCSLCEIVRIL